MCSRVPCVREATCHLCWQVGYSGQRSRIRCARTEEQVTEAISEFLRIHASSRGLTASEVEAISRRSRLREYAAGEYVQTRGELVDSLALVISGRFAITQTDTTRDAFGYLGPNDEIGTFPIVQERAPPTNIIALEPSRVIELARADAQALMDECKVWARNLLSNASAHLTQVAIDGGARKRPQRIAFLHICRETAEISSVIQSRLTEIGERLGCLTNSLESLAPMPGRQLVELRRDVDEDVRLATIREQLSKWIDMDRVVFDLEFESMQLGLHHLEGLLGFLEKVFIITRPKSANDVTGPLRAVVAKHPEWREKVDLVWVLDDAEGLAPLRPELMSLINRDFKVKTLDSVGQSRQQKTAAGVERVVHALRGVHIGLALGGGAARGMSHLGVLKALDEAGIVVDAIAGTSVGAMMAVPYCGGYTPDDTVARFTKALTPGGLFRWVAMGDKWYLLFKYRSKSWEGMLRKHFYDWQIEQLLIPLKTVAADLVKAEEFVRTSGDAVHGILESINLGGISAPICRDGMVLVDGGYLNNVPADTLVRDGATFVLSVDVSRSISNAFGSNTPATPTARMKVPGALQTLSRIREVAQRNLSALGSAKADFCIAPDVSHISFADFKSTPEIARIGYEAALEALPRLECLLHEHDRDLFPRRAE